MRASTGQERPFDARNLMRLVQDDLIGSLLAKVDISAISK
jgi:hypothetical protein